MSIDIENAIELTFGAILVQQKQQKNALHICVGCLLVEHTRLELVTS